VIAIRHTPVTDAQALRLIGESEAELASLYPPEARHAFSPDQLIAAEVHFVTAWDGPAAVGCGGVAPCHGYGELKRIFTTRSARGRGVGRAVVAALEDWARARGLPAMRLETGSASPDAIALYQRLGYARRGPFGAYAENGSSVFMEKPLGVNRKP
jgi:putative acetyltransferase